MKHTISKTEILYSKSDPIDKLDIFTATQLMASEQKEAVKTVEEALPSINVAIEEIYNHLKLNIKGRLIYVGAGTSGRIGIQDGVELYPTFNWPKKRLDFIIAGGNKAILKAVENAEDDILEAAEVVKKKFINSDDIVIGLAASGNTPFTCKVLEEAKSKNSLTVAISNNPHGKILEFGKVNIILDTKEEVIAGSTRLKAGTAQKICLNIISSLVMVKFGRVKNGFMNEMIPTNQKLRLRKAFINKIL